MTLKLTYATIDKMYVLFNSILDKGNIPTNLTTRRIIRILKAHVEDFTSQLQNEPIAKFLKENMNDKGFVQYNTENPSQGERSFKELMATIVNIDLPKYNQNSLCMSFGNSDLDSNFADILIELDLLEDKQNASN